MFKRIISYPNGSIKYIETDKITTIEKGEPPKVIMKTYNKKENHGFIDRIGNLPYSSDRDFLDCLLTDI